MSNVEILVKASGLHPIVIHRKGYPRVPGSTHLSRVSGFNVDVSRADDGRVEKQARDAIRFLKRHAAGLERLRSCKGFGGMTLDFGLYDRATEDTPWPSYRLPVTLIELAGEHSIEIELSFYGQAQTTPANTPLQPPKEKINRSKGTRVAPIGRPQRGPYTGRGARTADR